MTNKVNKPPKNHTSIYPDTPAILSPRESKINAFFKIKEISSPSKKEKSKFKKNIKNLTLFKMIKIFLQNTLCSSVWTLYHV